MHLDKESLKGVRILAIDDDEKFLKVIVAALRASGAEVNFASNGRLGLQLLFDHSADVLLVDMAMPELDGVGFLQEAINIWPWIGVVVMSGHAVDRWRDRLDEFGVQRIIAKPFPFGLIIREIAAEYHLRREAASQDKGLSIFRFQQQLQLLRHCTEPALQSESLLEAMRSLTVELDRALDFAVIGICGLGISENAAIFNIREPVTSEFIADLKYFMAMRYCALTGDDASMELAVELQGLDLDPQGASKPGSQFCVPIMSAGEVQGFLVLASAEQQHVDDAEIAFIYNVANHLSTVFTALNRMRRLAIRDALTGLYSRLHLESELARLWSSSARYGRPLSIVIMDFDHFKTINDTYGHQAGDKVLVEFAQLLEKAGRTSDVVGRYGGEEFLVLLPDCGQEDARAYCKRFLQSVRDHTFLEKELDLHLTVSIGASAAEMEKLQNSSIDELLAEADQALYLAKNAGRNCVRVWTRLAAAEQLDQQVETQSSVKAFTGEETLIMRPLSKGSVLIADDDDDVRMILAEMLRFDHYEVAEASNGEKALALIKQDPEKYDVVLADIHMPGMNGIELVKEVKEFDDTIVCIIISGHASLEYVLESIHVGVFDFIRKPHVAYEDVMPTFNNAIEFRRAILENRQYQRHLSEMVRLKSDKVREVLQTVRQSYEFTLEALVTLLDARERDTGDHSKRVRALVMRLARELDWPEDDYEFLSYGVLLHDIGKIAIPDHILLKPGKHTDEEREIMRQHASIGYRVLCGSPYLARAADIVYSHQEAYDGSGYPRGLIGGEIPLGARIFSVIDAYDAMRSDRVYRAAMPEQVAVEEIIRNRGRQFDPTVVDAFLRCRKDLAQLFECWDAESCELLEAMPGRNNERTRL